MLDPPPDGDVIDAQAPLGQEFLYVAIREREAQIPIDRQEKSRYQANAETIKGNATFEGRTGNKYSIEPKGYNSPL